MIYYLPLEHIDKRYTADMDDQIMRELKKQQKSFIKIDGELADQTIDTGAFLDASGTFIWKFSQLSQVAELFRNGVIKPFDTFFISDIWFPGVESIRYMSHFYKIPVQLKGMLHAGSFTETDYVRGMESWAQWTERGWLQMFDKVFLGSNTIAQELYSKGRVIDPLRVQVTGLPFSTTDLYEKYGHPKSWNEKDELVVFVGRLDMEKQPWKFEQLEKDFRAKYPASDVKFVKSMDLKLSKADYFKLLSSAKVVYSAALQENFGYGVLEATAYGCMPILPNRLSYKDLFPEHCLYSSDQDALNKLSDIFYGKRPDVDHTWYAKTHDTNTEDIVSQL